MFTASLRRIIIESILALLLATPVLAQTPVTNCATLSAPGAYTVPSGSTFNLQAPGDCVIIAGANITFTADSLVINGPVFPPGGTGIHILATAPNAVVTLTGDTNIGGAIATQELATSIEDDASNTQINLQGFVDAEFNPAGGSGWGIFLNNATNTSITISPGPAGDTGIDGDDHGLFILGGSHNSVVSGFDTFGDGGEAGVFEAGTGPGIVIRNSNHNQINHVGATGAQDGILLDNSPGNLVYNNTVQAEIRGIRARWNSPNNVIIKNFVLTPGIDLFQGTHPTTVGCNGNYWANNTSADDAGNPIISTSNQSCVTTMQAMTAY